MNNLIEKLKDKTYVRAFGLMTPLERECLEKVGKRNCYEFTSHRWIVPTGDSFFGWLTYAIKPDYQPESEYVDYEIGVGSPDNMLGVYLGKGALPCPFVQCACLLTDA